MLGINSYCWASDDFEAELDQMTQAGRQLVAQNNPAGLVKFSHAKKIAAERKIHVVDLSYYYFFALIKFTQGFPDGCLPRDKSLSLAWDLAIDWYAYDFDPDRTQQLFEGVTALAEVTRKFRLYNVLQKYQAYVAGCSLSDYAKNPICCAFLQAMLPDIEHLTEQDLSDLWLYALRNSIPPTVNGNTVTKSDLSPQWAKLAQENNLVNLDEPDPLRALRNDFDRVYAFIETEKYNLLLRQFAASNL